MKKMKILDGSFAVPNSIGIIDGHCHLSDSRYLDILDEVVHRSQERGVFYWIQGGIHPEDWKRQLLLCQKYPGQFFPAFGLHPVWISQQAFEGQESEGFLSQLILELEAYLPHAIGLGELGLDFGKNCTKTSYPFQIEAFKTQMKLAKDCNRPLVLHLVKSHGTAIPIMKEIGVPRTGGIVHSFSGNFEIAQEYIRMGLVLSISGGITRNGFETLKRAVLKIPLQYLAIETDSPDQSPLHWREEEGKEMNEPASLIEIAEALAKLKKIELLSVLKASNENLKRVFELVE